MRGAHFHAFQTNGQIGHTCAGPQTLRWPRAPHSLNPSLLYHSKHVRVTFGLCQIFFVARSRNHRLT